MDALRELDPVRLLLLRLLLHLELVSDFHSGAPPGAARVSSCTEDHAWVYLRRTNRGAPSSPHPPGTLHRRRLGNGESEVRSLTTTMVRTFPAGLTPIKLQIKIELDSLSHVVDLRRLRCDGRCGRRTLKMRLTKNCTTTTRWSGPCLACSTSRACSDDKDMLTTWAYLHNLLLQLATLCSEVEGLSGMLLPNHGRGRGL